MLTLVNKLNCNLYENISKVSLHFIDTKNIKTLLLTHISSHEYKCLEILVVMCPKNTDLPQSTPLIAVCHTYSNCRYWSLYLPLRPVFLCHYETKTGQILPICNHGAIKLKMIIVTYNWYQIPSASPLNHNANVFYRQTISVLCSGDYSLRFATD